MKIHRLSCSNKKNQKTETSKPSETEVNKHATVNHDVASEAEENVQKEQKTSAMVPNEGTKLKSLFKKILEANHS